jgi:16S rRNA (adenine1518-N6/adenine1519-N6)-dimethyltransferase
VSNPIQIVDDNDNPISTNTKQEAWDKGLRHRIVRVMIENDAGEILLQHRSPTKDIFPNCWCNSAAGHVDAGESYDQAAVRELREELGLSGIKLKKVGIYESDETWKGHRLKRFTTVYKASSNQAPQKLEIGKVDDARWFKLEAIKKMIRREPDTVSDGLRQVIERYY